MVVVPHKTSRLQFVDKGILVGKVPGLCLKAVLLLVAVPNAVKPYCPNLAVIGKELGKLRIHEFEVVLICPVGLEHG